MERKIVTFNLSSTEGGLNSADDPTSLANSEFRNITCNSLMRKNGGHVRQPGALGISANAIWNANGFDFLHFFIASDGSEYPLAGVNGVVNYFSKYDETILNTAGTCLHYKKPIAKPIQYGDNLFFGNSMATYPDAAPWYPTMHRLGVDPPASVTADANFGGTLPIGVYKVFVSYAIVVSGIIRYYSRGKAPSVDVTLSGTNQSIAITVPASTDSRVTHLVVWMTDAGGSVWYYFKKVAATTSPFTVTSTSERDETIVYTETVFDNYPCPSTAYAAAVFKDRLWAFVPAIIDNALAKILYYTEQTTDPYGYEVFPAANFIQFQDPITAVIPWGEHLYVSTLGGLYRLPYGDPPAVDSSGNLSNIPDRVNSPFYFLTQLATDIYENGIIGLTNYGVRVFDGVSFSSDLSRKVSPEITKAVQSYNLASDTASVPITSPYALTYRRNGIRNEFIFTYSARTSATDEDIDESMVYHANNRALVLDLDRLHDPADPRVHWEMRKPSGDLMARDTDNLLYFVQNIRKTAGLSASCVGPKIWKENTTPSLKWVYGGTHEYYNPGAGQYYGPIFLSTETNQLLRIVSKVIAPTVQGRLWIYQAKLLIEADASSFTIGVYFADGALAFKSKTVTISDSGGMKIYKVKFPMNMKGYAFYVDFQCSGKDPVFMLDQMLLLGELTTGNQT